MERYPSVVPSHLRGTVIPRPRPIPTGMATLDHGQASRSSALRRQGFQP
jgi:hypothetical protein